MTAVAPAPDGVPVPGSSANPADGVAVPGPGAGVTAGPRLLATFHGLSWVPGGRAEAWLGEVPPADLPVTSACVLAVAGDHLLLVDVRSRGWDLPGGRLKPGESASQALLRELDEEAGLAPDDVDPPRPLGWFRLGDPDGDPDGDPQGGAGAMLVYRAGLHPAAVRWLATRVPDEIADVRTFPLDCLPGGTADRIWRPYLDGLRLNRAGG